MLFPTSACVCVRTVYGKTPRVLRGLQGRPGSVGETDHDLMRLQVPGAQRDGRGRKVERAYVWTGLGLRF